MGDLSDSDGMIMDEAAVNSAASSRSGGRLHTEKAIGVKIDLVKQADDEKQQNLDPKWARECKNKANEFVEQLQGEWRLQCSSAGHKDLVADWLSAFSIDGHDVTSQDGTEQQLEIITEMKVCLCGGELKLDNLGNLHRHGRSGQHLVFSPCEEMSQEQESSRSHRELS
ncbi:Uncharacterized protein SCF082_LOCUS46847 [Durusdinium trenchii]|uniref:Uncharacterized protein n=1 Tax=Durusdinium trenchii TaxID=1381693 RepID=A0ABP0RHL8_9DINO